MGWAEVSLRGDSPLWRDFGSAPRFYFTHSYHFLCQDESLISATARYGYEFTCAFQKDNIFGIQFHPEKSHRFGMRLLENFSRA
jgi:glutamine amidotransferase